MITIPRVEYEELKGQLAELKRLIFGRKSERFMASDSAQTSLFATASPPDEQAPTVQSVTYPREVKAKEKRKPVRALLPAHLPREEEVIEPADWAAGMIKIGEEVTEILEQTPARLYVRRIVRPKYVKTRQEGEGVHIAALPLLPIPKGNAGPGLLAHIQVSKWVDHLPFYRQIQVFKREGVSLAESTLTRWFNGTAQLLEPLYHTLVTQVQGQAYLQADESPIRVQDQHKHGATHTGYHWVYHAPKSKLVVFDYQPCRSARGPTEFLQSFTGSLQTDGYSAYNTLDRGVGVTLLACMAHVRRYFEKALENDRALAEYALQLIQALYALERTAQQQHLDVVQRQALRESEALPLLKGWKTWLDQQQQNVLPKSSIGKAVHYTLNLWPRLVRYVEDGNYCIDNNLIENTGRLPWEGKITCSPARMMPRNERPCFTPFLEPVRSTK